MSNLVNLESVRKAYGLVTLLDGVSLGLHAGDRVGVVGRNGAGKSTLLRMMGKLEEPDSGRVTHVGGLRVGVLKQGDDLEATATIRECVVGDMPEHEWAGDARVREVFTGLFGGLDLPGFPEGPNTVVGPLSGGERRRIALARELVRELDLLVLDEPTNHLDVECISWLAGHLAGRSGALLMVTHDRWFLDAVCTLTWEVSRGQVFAYDGGYSAYVLAKAERERVAGATEQRRQNLLRKELAWLRRGPPARTSKPQFRIDAANALIADEPPARDSVELAKFAANRLGRTVLELDDVSLELGGKQLLKRVTWALGPGARIGLVGVNGSGKTSVLRMFDGTLTPAGGKIVRGATVQIGYLTQEIAAPDPTDRVLSSIERIAKYLTIGKKEHTASDLAEKFGFTGERQWAVVGDLSGGEKRRLALLRILMSGANVLLLDEPTNDLDIETLTRLEDLLDGWAGSLVVVSHDRYFLERVTDSILALYGDGTMRAIPGGVDEYLAHRQKAVAMAGQAEPAKLPPKDAAPTSAGDARAARKEVVRIERRLDRIRDEEAKLHQQMAEHASDHAKVLELDAKLRAFLTERDQLEEAWLEAAELAQQ
ncbi:MAG: ABC-F family ATP-binding cassette domain-containing protein [Sporichthyaceae bacterium]